MKLNYDFVEAKPLVLPMHEKVSLNLIGCGGTGSWLAASLCRLARVLTEKGKPTQVTFIDPDIVEQANVTRQNFCDAEIGLNKAQTLAVRYSMAWGIEITAIPQPLDKMMIDSEQTTLTILIGCVDNAQARNSIANALEFHQQWRCSQHATSFWWLDCGNHETSGQVLLGSHLSTEPEFYQFHELGCIRLPAPTLQHPDLLVPRPEELNNHNLSCEQLAMLNAQSLGINQRVAAEATEYLIQLTTRQLKRFATYFDLASGSANSYYLVEKTVLKAINTISLQGLYT
ncbi:MAG: PRTRC system ThiF family protein [Symploca sp. SIO2E9]|nr:PRTRC system ThiF family protein [Symploca sp. SIO2E9]